MLCLIACFIGGKYKTPKKFNELLFRYSPNDVVKINGKIWRVIQHKSNGNCWMYSYENCAGKFITTFSLFHLNENGDFIQLPFSDGVDKIETAHDHAPTVCGKNFQVKLRNGKIADVCLDRNSLYYDNYCSIAQIK